MQAWEEFLLRQEQELGRETVKKWLRTLKILRFDACNLFLEAKDSFQALWFEEHIRSKVVTSLVNNNHKKIRVHLSIGNRPQPVKSPSKVEGTQKIPLAAKFQLNFDLPDPLCTFENYVVLESNQIPIRLLKENLTDFNPIYLYGGMGAGKTHLLKAVALDQESKGKKVIYARAETFTDHVVSAIRSGEMGLFRQTYRNTDILILDDVHILSRKGATQEELFHTFNTLHLMGKQILLGSNCSPVELKEIEPRLVSRFEWGIVLPLETAKDQDLLSLLKQKAKALDYPLPPKVAEYLMESFQSSPKSVIRALEALILRSHVQQDLHIQYRPMTIQLAKHYLSDLLLAEKQNTITPEKIIQFCSDHYGIRPEDILGKAQTRDCAQPRQIAMFLCREQLKIPFKKIGEIFGRDHSTVMSSVRLVQKSIENHENEFSSALSSIEKKIGK